MPAKKGYGLLFVNSKFQDIKDRAGAIEDAEDLNKKMKMKGITLQECKDESWNDMMKTVEDCTSISSEVVNTNVT